MESMKIVVRAPNWVGDAVLALPAMMAIKKNFPESEIRVAAEEWVEDLFSMSDMFPDSISLPKQKGIQSFKDSVRKIRDGRFDLGILLTNSFSSALVFAMARIPQRWGYNKDGRGLLLTKRVPVHPQTKRAHQVHYYLALLSGLGLETDAEEFALSVNGQKVAETKAWLDTLNVQIKNPLVIINPGGYYGSAKRWPAEKYAELASLIQDNYPAQIMIIGSSDEKPLAEAISSRMKTPPLVLTGQTSLSRLAALIRFADLFVTNDSGPMHLANFLKVPVVALFGPTEPARTGPFLEPSVVVHKGAPCWPCSYRQCPFDHRCMMDITPDEVFQSCQRLLG